MIHVRAWNEISIADCTGYSFIYQEPVGGRVPTVGALGDAWSSYRVTWKWLPAERESGDAKDPEFLATLLLGQVPWVMTNPFVWVGRYELTTLVVWLLAAGAILAFAVMADAVAAGPAAGVHGEYREFTAGHLECRTG
jgi:hypothetical protein